MKILQVSERFYPCVGGIENYVENLCLHLIKRGHKVDVCCLNRRAHSSEKPLKPQETYKGIKIYRVPYLKTRSKKDHQYRVTTPKILKIVKSYDIIHVHGMSFFLDFLLLTKPIHKKPLILSTHGAIFHDEGRRRLKDFYFDKLFKKMSKKIDRIIAVSKNDEKRFSRVSKNVVFIPDGIDFNTYSKIKRKPKKNTLLFIGRLSPNKKIERLIDVVCELKKAGKLHNLYIAGSEWKGELKRLEHYAKSNNVAENVKFLGEISEKKKLALLSKAEFFVSASQYEGFGISVIEAMAAGAPVIVNDIEAFRNFVKNGENGLICDYLDSKEIFKLILNISNKSLSKISRNAKKTASGYDWNRIVKKIEVVYEKCLKTI